MSFDENELSKMLCTTTHSSKNVRRRDKSKKSNRVNWGNQSRSAAFGRHDNADAPRKADRMILYSGTTAHVTTYVYRMTEKKPHTGPITLADESPVWSSY